MILLISGAFLLFSIIFIFIGCVKQDDGFLAVGWIGGICTIIFGFLILGCTFPVEETEIYLSPDSIFRSKRQTVCTMGKLVISSTEIYIYNAPDNRIRVILPRTKNSYGFWSDEEYRLDVIKIKKKIKKDAIES